MDDFRTRVRAALAAQGMSIRGAARALNYDVSYLSRVVNGKQQPSPRLAEGLDELLGQDGELAALATKNHLPAQPDGPEAGVAHMKESATYLLQHANRYGSDTVAPTAVQVWRSAQRKLDSGSIPEKEQLAYLAAVAESAEVAGWLLYDAGQWDAARAAFLESHMLARHAGDRSMQWFALDLLAMLDIEIGRPGEALRIADEVLGQRRVPPRVALLAQVRRGRALAQIGEHQRTQAALKTAKGYVEESLSPSDPGWTWWVDEGEVRWHRGVALLELGAPEEAIPAIHGSIERLTIPDGRGALHERIGLLSAFAKSKAWREAETELETIASLLHTVRSGRNRYVLRRVLRTVDQESHAPAGLSSLAMDVATALAP
ncbi:helix-turn-helix transcriptional regulator [Streptomyces sp. ME19-01-6]|uniref:helix-turn-helix domain-containing protein n=1 Tax=Streptomyces sp. ME19-01-6 TaxID=3028686 RepID=UPI0029B0B62B|nr:helix-turn-helix transcriptional regulator [Streptomyces sp. ME19-01-6]MDX3226759.1 helix-turn-helix transcriptional regulator [Streptomyces sp. ME19-01-6]